MGQTAQSHVSIVITAERLNAVLLAEEDWRVIQETVYLLSLPGMRSANVSSKPGEDGGFTVFAPTLPGCISEGESKKKP